MTDKTHQAIGFSAAAGTFFVLNPTTPLSLTIAATVLTGAFIGSLFPDIDQPTSKFWDSILLGHLAGDIAPRALGGHRHLSHSILGAFLFYLLSSLVVSFLLTSNINHAILIQSLMAGFIAHLAADSVTERGIPLFWPLFGNMGFPPRPLQGIRMVTGKWFENLVVFPCSLLLIGFILLTNQDHLCGLVRTFCR